MVAGLPNPGMADTYRQTNSNSSETFDVDLGDRLDNTDLESAWEEGEGTENAEDLDIGLDIDVPFVGVSLDYLTSVCDHCGRANRVPAMALVGQYCWSCGYRVA